MMAEGIVEFSDWQKLDLRTAEILEAKDIEGADKLYQLKIDLGTETRILVAGLKPYYTREELEGKQFVFVTNLEPKKFMGEKSEAMILAAVKGEEIVLVQPERKIDNGTKIE